MDFKPTFALDTLQKLSLSGMAVLMLITFVGANLHAVLWQSSQWLVSTVLPAVVVQLTNEERSDIAREPLRRSQILDAAAQMKAEHMARNQYFSHYAPDGTSPWYWFDRAGYVYAHAGENLAVHFTDSDEVVKAWMKSPTHRANIVNGVYTEIGVGTAKGTFDGYNTVFVVQLFGTPAQTPIQSAQTTIPPTAAEIETELASTPVRTTLQTPIEPVTEVLAEADPFELPPSEPLAVAEIPQEVLVSEDVVVVEREIISTSSGLAIATINEPPVESLQSTIAGIATKPSAVLQIIYGLFAVIIITLLIVSAVIEAKQMRYVQVAYSFGLLVVMAGLWYVHALLTTGAVIA